MGVSLFAQSSGSVFVKQPAVTSFSSRGNAATGYSFAGRAYTQTAFSDAANARSASSGTASSQKTQEMRELLRAIEHRKEEDGNSLFGTMPDRTASYGGISKTSDRDKKGKLQKKYNYNFKDVSNRILRAKTSVNAGQAMIAAKRKVTEVKRKIANSEGDAEDLQLALTHAQRMEMVARRKKHHLEQEELAAAMQQREEQWEKQEESAANMENAVVEAAQEKITGQEDMVLEERQRMLDWAVEQQEKAESVGDRMEAFSQMLSEFGEEVIKELEEAMEMLEDMEILDPHMSEEQLEEVKRKHRNAENRAIVKADMDYLKGILRHTAEKGVSISAMGSGSAPSVSVESGSFVAAAPVSPMPSIDVQV